MDQLKGIRQVSALTMIQNLFSSYELIDKIDHEENVLKMMGTYNSAEPFARLIKILEKGREFTQAGVQTISSAMMMSKRMTLLAQTGVFNNNIREWRR